MILTAKNVDKVFDKCTLPTDAEMVDSVHVHGIVNGFSFSKSKLEKHKDDIVSMLHHLPHQFQEKLGGGWSFLNACHDANGKLWTGMHVTMEKLFALGLAIGRVQESFPRDTWSALPGGMPYYMVTDQ